MLVQDMRPQTRSQIPALGFKNRLLDSTIEILFRSEDLCSLQAEAKDSQRIRIYVIPLRYPSRLSSSHRGVKGHRSHRPLRGENLSRG